MRIYARQTGRRAEQEAEVKAFKNKEEEAKKAKKEEEDLADLLDDIDEVLQENAEQFVKAYQQRGGQ